MFYQRYIEIVISRPYGDDNIAS